MTSDDVMSIETGFGFVMSIVALLYLTFATKESSSKVLKVIILFFNMVIGRFRFIGVRKR